MYLSQHDLLTGAISFAIILLALVCIELTVKKKLLSKLFGRKLLHITAICSCAYTIHAFGNKTVLACIFLSFFFVLLAVIKKGWMQVNAYKTYGIALFPLAFAVLLFIPAFPNNIIVFAALILGICDAAAGLTGEYFGKQKITFLFESKSWAGFAAFYLSALLISFCWYGFNLSANKLLLCTLLALLPAITELFSYKGSDNFTVPVCAAIWMLLLKNLMPGEHRVLLLCIVVFIALCFFAVYRKWLTVSGATAALWMALLLLVTGGLKAFIAPGIFLLSGSLLSKLNNNDKEKNGRNAIQVFCNGIVGISCLILFAVSHQQVYLLAALVSFCISMSDSVSSELGTYLKGTTVDMLSFKKLPPGISGGISWQGSLSGLIGAAILAAAVCFAYQFSLTVFLWITVSGFMGMLADSILGSTIQKKYTSATGAIIEDYETNAVKVKGFNWCNNDMVNILSNILITSLFLLLYR